MVKFEDMETSELFTRAHYELARGCGEIPTGIAAELNRRVPRYTALADDIAWATALKPGDRVQSRWGGKGVFLRLTGAGQRMWWQQDNNPSEGWSDTVNMDPVVALEATLDTIAFDTAVHYAEEAGTAKARIEELERQVEAWKSAASYIITGPELKHMRATTPEELKDASKRLNGRVHAGIECVDAWKNAVQRLAPTAKTPEELVTAIVHRTLAKEPSTLAEQRVTSAGQAIIDIGARLGAKPSDGQNVLHFADVLMETISARTARFKEMQERVQLLENAKAIQSLRCVANLVGVQLTPGTNWGLKIAQKYKRMTAQHGEFKAEADRRMIEVVGLRTAVAEKNAHIDALEPLNKRQHETLCEIDKALGDVSHVGDAYSEPHKYLTAIAKLKELSADDELHREISSIVHARAGSAEIAMSAAHHCRTSNPATSEMFRKIAGAYIADLQRKLERKE